MNETLVIRGGAPLVGAVSLHGAKNAVLPLLLAGTMTEDEVEICDCPDISDVNAMISLVRSLGVDVKKIGRKICLKGSPKRARADGEWAKLMRSSMFMLGALLSSVGEVHMPLPGGCDIGARPLDIHLDGLKAMGVRVEISKDGLSCFSEGLKGADILMRYPSVGATENLMMAASLADGHTHLVNCAREPEIVCLAKALNAMGAKISGEGSSVINVEGVKRLRGASLMPCGDRIVAGTLIAAVAAAGGNICISGATKEDCSGIIDAFESDHCLIECDGVSINVRSDGHVCARNVSTAPFPLFPTDMQAQFMAAMIFSDGISEISETVFERRFSHAAELAKTGADITLSKGKAVVRGSAFTGKRIKGADMIAGDLRAGAGLTVAALAAEGESRIFNSRYIDRGYEDFAGLLRSLGADCDKIAQCPTAF